MWQLYFSDVSFKNILYKCDFSSSTLNLHKPVRSLQYNKSPEKQTVKQHHNDTWYEVQWHV